MVEKSEKFRFQLQIFPGNGKDVFLLPLTKKLKSYSIYINI